MGDAPVGIDDLRDIHLPANLHWFQPSPLWWLLLLASLAVVALVCLRWRQRRRAANPLFQTRQALEQGFRQWRNDGDSGAYLHSAATALKLFAIRQTKRTATARLTGNDWINWLNAQSSQPLGDIGKTALTTELYQHKPQTDIASLHQALGNWLQHNGKPDHA